MWRCQTSQRLHEGARENYATASHPNDPKNAKQANIFLIKYVFTIDAKIQVPHIREVRLILPERTSKKRQNLDKSSSGDV